MLVGVPFAALVRLASLDVILELVPHPYLRPEKLQHCSVYAAAVFWAKPLPFQTHTDRFFTKPVAKYDLNISRSFPCRPQF